MSQREPRFDLPITAIICLIVFFSYVMFTTGYQSLSCQRAAPNSVQCKAVEHYLFGLVTGTGQSFTLDHVEVQSELRDRTPRGGVRFLHTVTFWSLDRSFTSNPFRSPLSNAAIREQLQIFREGNGPPVLSFQHPTQIFALVRSGLLALLLSIVTWSFWDIR